MAAVSNRDVPRRSAPDPTESKTIRDALKRAFNGRLRRIKGDFRATILDNDAFRLKERDVEGERTQDDLPPSLASYLSNDEPITSTRPDDLRAVEDAARLDQLDAWLEYVYSQRLLEPTDAEAVRAGEHWTAEHLNKAYIKGDRLATRDLKRAGFDIEQEDPSDVLFDARDKPVLHQEYTETYRDIEYLSNDLRRDTHRNAAALLGGTVALSTFLDGVREPLVTDGGTRMAQIADVRMVETINRGALERYAATEGVTDVGVMIEEPGDEDEDGDEDGVTHGRWEDAGDDRVCPTCASLSGMTFPIDQIRRGNVSLPPEHPHCRCRIVYYDARADA